MFDRDESEIESGQPEIECPFCESTEECPHLLAIIDCTFTECIGGLVWEWRDEFRDVIANAFRQLRVSPSSRDCSFPNETLQELWDALKGEEDVDEDDLAAHLDSDVLTRLIVELLESGEDVESQDCVHEGGPGYSSQVVTLHAKDPETVFLRAMAGLQKTLRLGDQRSTKASSAKSRTTSRRPKKSQR